MWTCQRPFLTRRLTYKFALQYQRFLVCLFGMGSESDHSEQIPTEYNEGQTLRAVRKQNQIPGERKEKTINDFPKSAAVGQILKDLDFPADKQTIVT